VRHRLALLLATAALLVGACSEYDATGAEETTTSTTTTSAAPEADPEPAEAPDVEVEGPIPGEPQTSGAAGLDEVGYVEEEYFVSGTAVSYVPDGALDPDGRWSLTQGDEAPFKTRILVKRPADADDASGVVVVEWNNVTIGSDGTPDWTFTSAEITRAGHTHVAVSAQAAGVDTTREGGIAGGSGNPLTSADPERYGSLTHPDDAWSYDIYRQVGALVRTPPASGPDPLDGQERTHVIAIGESQSAFRLTAFANGVQPLRPTFDGFLIHSRGGGAAAFDDEERTMGASLTGGVQIRDDLDVPVLVFTTETDLTVLGYASARQPDTDRFRGWEVAGTAHADAFLLGGDPATGEAFGCGLVNDGPQHLALKAALAGLVGWVTEGEAPPEGSRIELDDSGAITRDEDGNAVGGIRLPPVDVPAAALSGDPGAEGRLCGLFGSTRFFPPEVLAERYGTRDDYLERVDEEIERSIDAGFLLEADRDTARTEAEEAWSTASG
jgi:hypothetical protein